MNNKGLRRLIGLARPDLPPGLLADCHFVRDFEYVIKTANALQTAGVEHGTPYRGPFTRPTGPAIPAIAVFKAPQEVFTLTLDAVGNNAIGAIKAVREITNIGLRDAKDLVDRARGMYSPSWGGPNEPAAPQVVHTSLSGEKFGRAKNLLTDAGCTFSVVGRFE